MKKSNKIDIILIIVFCVCSGIISVSLGQDKSWDLRNYHFYNAYSFINHRLVYDIAPAQLQSYHNPLLDIVYYGMITLLTPKLYGFLVGAFQGLNIWLVYKISYFFLTDLQKIRRYLLSLCAGIIGYYGAANLSEIGTTFSDNVTSLLILSAVLLVVSSMLTDNGRVIYYSKIVALIGGFLLGCAAGLKLPAAIYGLSFSLCVLLLKTPIKVKLLNAIISGLGIILGMVVTSGYWMIILWKNYQSPLFPYYNKIFRSPYYELSNFIDNRFFPQDKYQVLFYPFHFLKDPQLVSEVSFRDIRFSICYILLMLYIFLIYYNKVGTMSGGQNETARLMISDQNKSIGYFFIVFFVISYVIWQEMFSIYRYLVPLELLSPIFIIIIMRSIFPHRGLYVKWALGIFLIIALTMSPMHWGRIPWANNYFGVKITSAKDLGRATVIMADNYPYSYIIPFFPKSTRFVSVNNNFLRPDLHTKFQDEVREIFRQSNGNLYLLYREKSPEDYVSILAHYDLKMSSFSMGNVSSNFDDELSLIPVFENQIN